MSEENELLQGELAHAGEVSPITPAILSLDAFRVATDTKVEKEEFLIKWNGKNCFPRCDLSTFTGVEKCGKTIVTSVLMSLCLEKQVLELERISDEPMKVMWFDTEQSKSTTHHILSHRISNLITNEEARAELDSHIFVFNVRTCTYQERMDHLITGIEAYRPDMVIIDNVSDLVSNVNDAENCTEVIAQLMKLASEYKCNITVVIHLNRTGEKRNLRGWLGSEILHKTYDAYYCEQIENTDVLSVEQMFTRKYPVDEKMYYRMNDNGLPEITEKPDYQPRDSNGRYQTNKPKAYQIRAENADTFNQDYIIWHKDDERQPWEWNLRKLFDDAMDNSAQLSTEELQRRVMAKSGIMKSAYYDKVFELAIDKRIIKTTLNRNGRVVVISVSA